MINMAEEEFDVEEETPEDVISSGNYEIDQKMGGGIPMGTLSIFEGQNDSGKSVFVQQIMWGGLNQGRRIAMFTTENSIKSLLKQMRSLSLDIDDFFVIGRLKIFPVHIRNSDEDKARGGSLLDFMLESMKRCKSEVIIIDSLTVFVFNSEDGDVLNFFTGCKDLCDLGKTIMLTAHGYAFPENLLIRIKSICDAHLHLRIEEVGDQMIKSLEVAKIRGARKSTGNIVSFDVDPGFGLRIIPILKVRA